MNIGQLTVSLGVDTTGLMAANAAMTRFQRNTVTSLNTMSQRFRTFGYLATAAVTVPIVMAGKAVSKLAMDYESSLSKVVGLVGIARDQVNAWNEDILKIGPSAGKGPKELGDALYYITSAGIRGKETMDVLTLSAKASAAGLGETKVVADLVTSAMNAYGKENLSASQATDILTATVREGKVEATALASTMGMALPIAAAMGVSFDQVGAAVAAMTRTGTKAATASMQLRQILNSLVKPAQQSEKALQAMGTSSATLRKTIKEDGLLTALMDIKNLTAKYGETIMARVFPNIRALSGVLDIMGKNLEENKVIFDEIANSTGSLEKAFAAASVTARFKFNKAIAEAQVEMVALGKVVIETIIPIFENLVGRLKNMTKSFTEMTDAQKENRLKWVMFLAILGPASMAISLVGYSVSLLIGLFKGLAQVVIWTTSLIRGLTGSLYALRPALAINSKLVKWVIGYGPKLLKIINPITALIALTAAGIKSFINYVNKVKQMAKDHNLFYNSLVKVNGELVKLNELTDFDISLMGSSTLIKAMESTRKAWEQANTQWKQAQIGIAEGSFLNRGQNKKMAKENYDNAVKLEALYKKLKDALTEVQFEEWHNKLSIAEQKLLEDTELANDALLSQIEQMEKLKKIWGYETGEKKFSKIYGTMPDSFADAYKAQQNQPIIGGGLARGGKDLAASPIIKEATDELIKQWEVVNDLQRAFEALFANTGNGFKGMADAFGNALKQMIAEIAGKALLFGIISMLTGGVAGAGSKLFKGVTGGKSFWEFIGFANGTNNAPGGMSLVGERGPELVNLPKGSQVIPNHLLSGIGSMDNMFNNVTFEISGDNLVGVFSKNSRRIKSFA